MTKSLTTLAVAGLLALSTAAFGQSASTVGTGGASAGGGTASGTIAGGGSAAAADGKAMSRTKINDNPNGLMGQSKAMAHDGGTFSKSQTKTKVKAGDELSTRTKSMAHVPGSKPVKSTTSTTVPVGQ